MDDHLHKDNIEDFFRESFDRQKQEPAEEHWDLPPDDMWDKIEERIPDAPQDSSRRGGYIRWILAITAVLAILLLLRFCNTGSANWLEEQSLPPVANESSIQGEEIEGEVEIERGLEVEKGSASTAPVASQAPTAAEVTPSVTAKETTAKQPTTTSPPVPTKATPSYSTTNKNTTTNSSASSSTPSSIDSSPPVANTQSPKNTATQQPQGSLAAAEARTTQTKPKEPKTSISSTSKPEWKILNPLSSLSIRAQSSTNMLAKLPPPEPIIRTPDKGNTEGGRFFVGLYYAPALAHRTIREPQRQFKRLWNDQEQPDKTFLAGGMKLGYRLSSHWSLEIGAHYSRSSVSSTHRRRLNYDRLRERLNMAGDYDSEYEMKLSTSLGEVTTNVALSRNAATTIPLNAPTFIVFDLEQDFSHLRIPLIASYQWGKGKVKMAMRAGLGANILIDKKVEVTRVRSNRLGLRHRRTDITDKFKGLDNLTFDALVGLGLEYEVGEHFSLLFEPTFIQSLEPVYQIDRSKTYPYILSMNMGVKYNF